MRFADPKSLERVVNEPVLHIPLPKEISDQPGGVGLNDLEGLFLPGEFDPNARDEAENGAVIASDRMTDGKLIVTSASIFCFTSPY